MTNTSSRTSSSSGLPVELLAESFDWITDRQRFAHLFYETYLFGPSPHLRTLFTDRGTDMPKQEAVLMETLSVVITLLKKGDMDSLRTATYNLGQKHQQYGVSPQWFETVGTALLETFPAYLAEKGEASLWTETYRTAWVQGYTAIAGLMLQGYEAPL